MAEQRGRDSPLGRLLFYLNQPVPGGLEWLKVAIRSLTIIVVLFE